MGPDMANSRATEADVEILPVRRLQVILKRFEWMMLELELVAGPTDELEVSETDPRTPAS